MIICRECEEELDTFNVLTDDIAVVYDKANTNLIANAPKLLKACKELLTYINASNEIRVIMYPQSIRFAENIINEAEEVI